jgi:hypothetical protein
MALSDPLVTKTADTITGIGADFSFARTSDDNPNFSEYRLVGMSGDLQVVQTIRVANYQNGNKHSRRIVVSELTETYDTVLMVEHPSSLVSVSMLIDDRTVDATELKYKIQRLAYLLVNTTDGGVLTRLTQGET